VDRPCVHPVGRVPPKYVGYVVCIVIRSPTSRNPSQDSTCTLYLAAKAELEDALASMWRWKKRTPLPAIVRMQGYILQHQRNNAVSNPAPTHSRPMLAYCESELIKEIILKFNFFKTLRTNFFDFSSIFMVRNATAGRRKMFTYKKKFVIPF